MTARLWTKEFVQRGAVWILALEEKKAAIGLESGVLKVVYSGTGETLLEDTEAHSEAVHCAEFSEDRKEFVTGSGEEAILLWCIETGAVIGLLGEEHTMEVTSLAFSRDGQRPTSDRQW